MDWNSAKLQYGDALKFLRKVKDENISMFTELDHYLKDVLDRLEHLLNESQGPLDSMGVHLPPRSEDGGSSASSIRPTQSAQATDCIVVGFKAAFRRFESVHASLATVSQQYHVRMDTLLANFQDGLAGLSDAHKRFDAAYSRYRQLGEDLRQAADRRAPDVADLKEQFVAAQREAVELHTHMNDLTAQTALRMEGTMTSYEDIEQWRSDQLTEFFTVVVDWSEYFAAQLKEGAERWAAFAGTIPDDSELEALFDGSDLPQPHADDRYQAVRIDPRTTQHLDATMMFVSEQKKKGELFRVTKNCIAHGQFMAAVEGEIVCATEDKGDNVMVVNINEASGLLPKDALAPFH
jgi:hypothetical protein